MLKQSTLQITVANTCLWETGMYGYGQCVLYEIVKELIKIFLYEIGSLNMRRKLSLDFPVSCWEARG